MRALCRVYFGLELVGVEHIPGSGPLIITPNHQTYADPPLVSIPVRRPVYYMAWSRLFEVPVFGRLIRLLRAFPRPGRIRITYHPPIHPDPGLDPKLAARRLAEQAHAAISGALSAVATR